MSNAFITPDEIADECYYRLAVGWCTSCTMVQQFEKVPRDRMFRADYPFRTSTSSMTCQHFEHLAHRLLNTELTGDDPFVVEIGSMRLRCDNDRGTTVRAGRHLRDPEAADRRTWLMIIMHTRLRLARPLAADLRCPMP